MFELRASQSERERACSVLLTHAGHTTLFPHGKVRIIGECHLIAKERIALGRGTLGNVNCSDVKKGKQWNFNVAIVVKVWGLVAGLGVQLNNQD